jgi:hypothetical protein
MALKIKNKMTCINLEKSIKNLKNILHFTLDKTPYYRHFSRGQKIKHANVKK